MRTSKVADDKLKKLLTSFPSGFLITTPSTTGDFLASACAYSGPTVYTYLNLMKKKDQGYAYITRKVVKKDFHGVFYNEDPL